MERTTEGAKPTAGEVRALTDRDLLEMIDEERGRIGLGTSLPLRIGVRRGKVFASYSRHHEDDCTGDSVSEVLAKMLVRLRAVST